MFTRTIIEFNSADDARQYRHENGTGGWIFVPENMGKPRLDYPVRVILFPPDMPPSEIFIHPITRGRTGELLA